MSFHCISQAVRQIRPYSTKKVTKENKQLVYASPNIGLIKLAKRFSLTTLTASALATPTIMYFWESPAVQAADMTGAMFLGESLTQYVLSQMLFTAMAASACSTGALTFLLSPYVNNMSVYTKEDGSLPAISPNTKISIETLDILTRKRTTTLYLKDLLPSNGSPLTTWFVNKKLIKRQYELEQTEGIEPKIMQRKFWLDQRNGMGNREVMSNIFRIIQEQGRNKFL